MNTHYLAWLFVHRGTTLLTQLRLRPPLRTAVLFIEHVGEVAVFQGSRLDFFPWFPEADFLSFVQVFVRFPVTVDDLASVFLVIVVVAARGSVQGVVEAHLLRVVEEGSFGLLWVVGRWLCLNVGVVVWDQVWLRLGLWLVDHHVVEDVGFLESGWFLELRSHLHLLLS